MSAGDDTLSGTLAVSAQVARDAGAIGPDDTVLRAQAPAGHPITVPVAACSAASGFGISVET